MDGGKDTGSVFRDAMLGVTPLRRPNTVPRSSPRPAPRAKWSRAAERTVLEESLSGELIEQAGGEIEFRRDGVGLATLGRLRSGRFAVADEIDLHGLTRLEAEAALKAFVASSVAQELTCIRVVHGKGSRSGPAGPVLKFAVQEWLARCGDVLAFASADRRHGGSGAVFVLLRRR